MRYIFEWDPRKAQENLRNHRVSFERASTVFRDPQAISLFDQDHSQEEDRWLTMGIDRAGSVLILSHTFQQIDSDTCRVRIISARKATKSEIRQYQEE